MLLFIKVIEKRYKKETVETKGSCSGHAYWSGMEIADWQWTSVAARSPRRESPVPLFVCITVHISNFTSKIWYRRRIVKWLKVCEFTGKFKVLPPVVFVFFFGSVLCFFFCIVLSLLSSDSLTAPVLVVRINACYFLFYLFLILIASNRLLFLYKLTLFVSISIVLNDIINTVALSVLISVIFYIKPLAMRLQYCTLDTRNIKKYLE